ncbi:MAG: hypothetical protein M0Q42_00285 [Xanthomonadales bacterium]|nr:hypothetical protein [Xanthomonadales bacterium]
MSPGAAKVNRGSGQWSRPVWLLVVAASLLLLAAAALYLGSVRQQRLQAQEAVVEARGQRVQLQRQLDEAGRLAELATRARALLADASANGLVPAHWGERHLNLRQQRLSRQAVDELLRGTARGPDRLFGADSFDLSVTSLDEGLFTLPATDGQLLQLSLRGSQLFRTGGPMP